MEWRNGSDGWNNRGPLQQNSESSKGLGQSLQNTEEVSIYRRNERGGKRKIKEALIFIGIQNYQSHLKCTWCRIMYGTSSIQSQCACIRNCGFCREKSSGWVQNWRTDKENKKSANASKPSSKSSKHFNSLQHPEQGSRSEEEKKSRSIQTAERKRLKIFYTINIEVKDRK